MKLHEVKMVDVPDEKEYYDFYGYVDFMDTREAQRILSKLDVLSIDIREEGGEDYEDVAKVLVHMTKPEVDKIDKMFYQLNRHMIKTIRNHPWGSYAGISSPLRPIDLVGRLEKYP